MGIEMATINVSKNVVENITDFYAQYSQNNSGEYIVFFAKYNDINITIYRTKDEEGTNKVLFSGKGALMEAKKWDDTAELKELKIKREGTKANWIDLDLQIGSDEVGTGDLFGPVVVVASRVKKEDITYLKSIGVDDSKRLSDVEIKRIAPILAKRIKYVHVCLDNEKYNQFVEKGANMNAIKAILHNKVLFALKQKYPEVQNLYVDQFCEPEKYYAYLKGTKALQTGITFKTKGESKYPSVAVSSIIARYSFIKKMEEISTKYGIEIPHGASEKVDLVAKEFLAKFGKEELDKIIKKNFVNYKNLFVNEE